MSTSLMSSSSGRFATSIVEMLRFAHTHTHTCAGMNTNGYLLLTKLQKENVFFFCFFFGGLFVCWYNGENYRSVCDYTITKQNKKGEREKKDVMFTFEKYSKIEVDNI